MSFIFWQAFQIENVEWEGSSSLMEHFSPHVLTIKQRAKIDG